MQTVESALLVALEKRTRIAVSKTLYIAACYLDEQRRMQVGSIRTNERIGNRPGKSRYITTLRASSGHWSEHKTELSNSKRPRAIAQGTTPSINSLDRSKSFEHSGSPPKALKYRFEASMSREFSSTSHPI